MIEPKREPTQEFFVCLLKEPGLTIEAGDS